MRTRAQDLDSNPPEESDIELLRERRESSGIAKIDFDNEAPIC
jgi:hypothetical protein